MEGLVGTACDDGEDAMRLLAPFVPASVHPRRAAAADGVRDAGLAEEAEGE